MRPRQNTFEGNTKRFLPFHGLLTKKKTHQETCDYIEEGDGGISFSITETLDVCLQQPLMANRTGQQRQGG